MLFVDNTYEADFDRDGDVDGADLTVWNSAYGLNSYADANSDGQSDGATSSSATPVRLRTAGRDGGDDSRADRRMLLVIAVGMLAQRSPRRAELGVTHIGK